MSEQENVIKEDVLESRSAHILKGIYFILVAVIIINCIILISGVIHKSRRTPIVSTKHVILHDNLIKENNKEEETEQDKEDPAEDEVTEEDVEEKLTEEETKVEE